ncbi:MAG: GDP-mannose 4,6-dehydratase, partial [Dehalococcoidales bacterium]|nr:GDP-mannose 4,6-dehydratase [Dehalococcoidales bacterium]
IGSNIVDRLSPDNNVFILDNFFTGVMTNLVRSKERVTIIKGDIRDKELVNDTVAKVEYIFHLAAHVGNIRSLKDPYFDMDVNIRGMLNLMEACRNNPKLKRVVYSSSAAIYGEAKYLPIDEDHPLNPESPYAVSKMAAEKYAFAFYKVYGVPTASVRYFNAFGPRQDSSEYANAVSIFLSRTRQGEPLTIFGDGEQTRDFIFIDDIVNANILAATHPAGVGQIFNIATGQATSINRIAEIIRQVSGKVIPITYADSRAGEVTHSRATIEKAKKLLGYNPQTSLDEGLRLTWQAMLKEKK